MESVEDLLKNYRLLVDKVDQMCQSVKLHYTEEIVCKKGCDNCCRSLSLFPVEAIHLNVALEHLGDEELKVKIRQRAAEALKEECPLLEQGTCLMYNFRPIICRTHGMPVMVEVETEAKVDYCPMNFKNISFFPKEMIIDIEQLNTAFAAINNLFLEQAFDPGSLPDRIPISTALLLEIVPGCSCEDLT